MMRTITLAEGPLVEGECLSCAVASVFVESAGGIIYEDKHFHAHPRVVYPIPGLAILGWKFTHSAFGGLYLS